MGVCREKAKDPDDNKHWPTLCGNKEKKHYHSINCIISVRLIDQKSPKTPGKLLVWVSFNSSNRQEISDRGSL
jgi:hypothetical protein